MSVTDEQQHPTVDEELDKKPGEPPADRSPVQRAARAVLRLVVAFVTGVFGELFGRAFREGRVDMKGRPTGTRTVQSITSLLYAAAVAAIVFAGKIRGHTDFAVTVDDGGGSLLVPRSTLWVTVLMLLVCLALLLAGVMGNLTDRITHGHVIDFLLFDLHIPFAHPWPAFNVADSCICIAVGCFIFHSFRQSAKPQPAAVE